LFHHAGVRSAALICSLLWLGGLPALPTQEASLEIADLSGAIHHPLDPQGKKGSVLIFYCHDCPICDSYVPEINRLSSRCTNFSFYVVEIDPDWTVAQAQAHAREFGLRPPMLLDAGHRLVARARATATPEAVVFGPQEQILYRGRIDDAYASLNQRRPAAAQHDLREALDTIAAGQRVTNEPPAIGCWIPVAGSRK
jgi:hypothetical protein